MDNKKKNPHFTSQGIVIDSATLFHECLTMQYLLTVKLTFLNDHICQRIKIECPQRLLKENSQAFFFLSFSIQI